MKLLNRACKSIVVLGTDKSIRSHPSAPDKPPFETVVGLMTAPVDKLINLFNKFPK